MPTAMNINSQSNRFKPCLKAQTGFTLIELLIVVGIIGALAAIAIPAFASYRDRAQVANLASDLRNFGTAFHSYAAEHGEFPNDSHIVLPPGAGMEEVIDVNLWLSTTPLGGNYNWEGPDNYPYAGIALLGVTASVSTVQSLDRILDDGNLATGTFRQTPNGRYTYILEE